MTKYIFVCGGVMSGIGKGVTAASIGRILKDYGFSVSMMKIDPYFNVDAGTLNPIVHGEVFVTDDGTESDQDLGNYERFLEQDMTCHNIMTSGLVYRTVIELERNLGYGGKDVQMMSDIPDEVIRRMKVMTDAENPDFVLVEVGGTVGDNENLIFLEAARVMKLTNPADVMFVLVSYLPVLHNVGEMKTKPTQHAVRALSSVGINTDMIIARGAVPLDQPRKEKISRICNIHPEDVISAPDASSIYEIPINFERDLIGKRILEKFGLRAESRDSRAWQGLVDSIRAAAEPLKIGIVGKYFVSGDFSLTDAYLSVIESVKHACWMLGMRPDISWLDAEAYEKDPELLKELSHYGGIIVPGGFGPRGVEGKISAVQYVREHNIPYFGLCYGMQMATIEFSRNVCGYTDANTTEVNPATSHPVIDVMPEQMINIKEKKMGGSMRLGAYSCDLADGTISRAAYGAARISERHRHRYEFNNKYRAELEGRGLVIAGINPDRDLVEIVELKNHPFFVGVQFHPEFKSRPLSPHPLYREFIRAALGTRKKMPPAVEPPLRGAA